jgi:hypothetical protein
LLQWHCLALWKKFRFCGLHRPPIKVEGMDRKGVVVASKPPHPHEGYYTKPRKRGSHEDHILHHHQQLLTYYNYKSFFVSPQRTWAAPSLIICCQWALWVTRWPSPKPQTTKQYQSLVNEYSLYGVRCSPFP